MSSPPDFDRVAHLYRWCEYLSLGPLLERTRFLLLPKLAGRRQALVLGDGDGRFLARLLAQNRDLHALAVDTSAGMLRLLTARCAASGPRLSTLQASALTVDPPAATDLIVTHFLLDCLTPPQVEALAQELGESVRPGCLWLVSDFDPPRNPLLRPFAAGYIRMLYLAFRVLTGLRVTRLPPIAPALSAAGFERLERHELCRGLLYTELWVRR